MIMAYLQRIGTAVMVCVMVLLLLATCVRSGSETTPQSDPTPEAFLSQDTSKKMKENNCLIAVIPSEDFVLIVREKEVEKSLGAIRGTVGLIPMTNEGRLLSPEKSSYVSNSYFPVGLSSSSIAIALEVEKGGIKLIVLFDRRNNSFQEFNTHLPYIAQVSVWKNQLVYSTEDPQAAVVMIETDTGDVHKFPTTKDDGLINAWMATTEQGVYVQDSNSKQYFLVTQDGLMETTAEVARWLMPNALELADFKDKALLERYRGVLVDLEKRGNSEQPR